MPYSMLRERGRGGKGKFIVEKEENEAYTNGKRKCD
jgi:hypothetical protein